MNPLKHKGTFLAVPRGCFVFCTRGTVEPFSILQGMPASFHLHSPDSLAIEEPALLRSQHRDDD